MVCPSLDFLRAMPGYLNDILAVRMLVDIVICPIAPHVPSMVFGDTSHFTSFHNTRITVQIYNISAIYPTAFLLKDNPPGLREKIVDVMLAFFKFDEKNK